MIMFNSTLTSMYFIIITELCACPAPNEAVIEAYAVLLLLEALDVSVLGRLTDVLAGIVCLVYPVVVELEELEELDDSSFLAQPLKIIIVNRTGIAESFEIFIANLRERGFKK